MANIIDLVLKGNTSDATTKIDKLTYSMSNLKSDVLLTTKNFVGLVKQLSKITDYTDEYNSSVRLLRSTLGGADKEATNFINKLGDMTGISTATLTKQSAKFIQLGQSLSFSNEQAEKFSENLSVLSTKLAMLYNTDYESMANALQKAVQGSQVTLKSRTGISINDMSMQATLNANAIDRQVSSLNDAEKALVRYATILRQVTNDTSVYQDAVNSLAWQKQMLSYQFKKLAAVTGQLLTPALTQLYIIMNGILMAAIELIKALGTIFNINMDMSSGVSGLADDYDDLGTSIGGAASAAKKSLRGFDKLNNLTTPSSGGGGGAFGIDKSLLRLLDQMDDQFFEIQNKATEIKNQILKWLGIKEDLSNAEEVFKNIFTWIKAAGGLLIGSKLGDLLGLRAKKKLGLAISLGSLPFYLDGVEGVANGQLTPENFMKAFAGAAGLGVGAGMLTGNWKLGLIITVGLTSLTVGLGLGEKIKEYVPDSIDWYIKEFNLDWDNDNWAEKALKIAGIILGTLGDAIIKFTKEHLPEWLWGGLIAGFEQDENQQTVADKLSQSIYKMFELINVDSILPLKILKDIYESVTKTIPQDIEKLKTDVLIPLLNKAILAIATEIEKIPIIGKGIASAIRSGVEASESEITTTIEDTTTSSIDTAKSKINNTSTEAGKEASSKYLGGMKDKFDQERNNLTRNIQTTVSSASSAAEATATTSGSKIANKETTSIGDTIYNNKTQLGTKVTNTIRDANNLVDTSSSINVGSEIASNVEQGVDNSNLGKNLNEKGDTIGEEFGEHISDNMKVNNSTLGTTLNGAISGALSRIKWNNWDLFGNGALSGLLDFNWTYFADGGFPKEGDLFFANEAGPELVGTMNNHPAVANNDQIVKGIQSGVFSGMMSALSNTDFGNQNVVIEANGDTEGLLDFIEFKQKQKSRQFN